MENSTQNAKNQVKENFNDSKAKEIETKVTETTTSAHIKFKDLASTEIDISCTLTLPSSFSQLLDSFKGSDTIVKFLFNRQETCTFLKLKMGIQNITKHTFALTHLAQIKTVYPLAYLFKQEKMFIDFKNDFHLTIQPNLDGKIQIFFSFFNYQNKLTLNSNRIRIKRGKRYQRVHAKCFVESFEHIQI